MQKNRTPPPPPSPSPPGTKWVPNLQEITLCHALRYSTVAVTAKAVKISYYVSGRYYNFCYYPANRTNFVAKLPQLAGGFRTDNGSYQSCPTGGPFACPLVGIVVQVLLSRRARSSQRGGWAVCHVNLPSLHGISQVPMISNARAIMENAKNHIPQERRVLSFSWGIVAVVVMRHIHIVETHARRHCGNPH